MYILCRRRVSTDGHERNEGRLRRQDAGTGLRVGRQAEGDQGQGREGRGTGAPRVPAEALTGAGRGEAGASAPQARGAEDGRGGALGSAQVRRRGRLERAQEERRVQQGRLKGRMASLAFRAALAQTRRHAHSSLFVLLAAATAPATP